MMMKIAAAIQDWVFLDRSILNVSRLLLTEKVTLSSTEHRRRCPCRSHSINGLANDFSMLVGM